MIGKHSPKLLATLTIKTVITGVLLSSIGIAQADSLVAQSNPSSDANISVTFTPPGGDAPYQTRGGASRGDVACTQNTSDTEQKFTPLTPTSSYGLTFSEHPVFFAYIPPTSAQAAFFSLTDEQGEVYYQTTMPIPTTGGLVEVAIPDTSPPLEVGKSYQWGMAILCSGRLRPDSPFISSWVKRTELSVDLANRLNAASPLEQAALYGGHGIWYDTLAKLVELRTEQPTDPTLSANWDRLLHSVGLDAVAATPVFVQP